MGRLPQTPRAKKVIEYAMEEARNLNHNYVGTEHLLLGLLREQDGVAAQVLSNLGLNLDGVRREVLNLLGHSIDTGGGLAVADADEADTDNGDPNSQQKRDNKKTPALDSFGRDLTELAKQKKLDPVIGREKEIERTMQILARRTKNNPVLLGEAGVGKTAIAEGLAQMIADGKAPEILLNQRVVALDLAMMVAGTKYRGQFEERIKALMQEIRKSKRIILFMDELHTIVGAGGAEGAMDASNILKPALSRGEIQCIGATTLDEYRKYIEKDSALDRRFQMVMVEPPSKEMTLDILKGLRERYEKHHRVQFTDDALKSAVDIADRYISGRCFPDKAIDVIDEAGARIHLKSMMKPEIVSEIDTEIETLSKEKELCVAEQNFEQALEYRNKIDDLSRQKKEAVEKMKEKIGIVDETVIAEVISKMTGIPLTRMTTEDAKRLMNMETELHNRVISQDEAIKAISKAVRRSRSGLKDPKRPTGAFIFAGPTGVGKTLLAKALTEFMFGSEDALIQLDMSEYMEKHNVSRLVGAPPGYVGYEEGGQLTEKVRRRPYSVVLLDEIEKAHPDVFNMMLQIMEEGRLTDSFGRNVDFRNAILIMTTNAGAEAIKNESAFGFQKPTDDASYESMKERVHEQIEKVFRPEFVGRCDDIIVFRHLTEKDLENVVDLELKKVRDRLLEKGLKLLLSEAARAHLIKKGSNLDFGARPLRRAIEGSVEDPLSEELLKGEFDGKEVVSIDVKTVGDKKQLFFEGKMFDDVDEQSQENLKTLYTAPKRIGGNNGSGMIEKPEHCVG
jgi:ATP-dependent Clp protease ATP-binding subunit ClpC